MQLFEGDCIQISNHSLNLHLPLEALMKQNESNIDRIIRVVAGIGLLYLGFGGMLSGALAIVSGVVGLVLLLTGAIGFCPLYAILKLSTLKK
jgi:hypothetical protein